MTLKRGMVIDVNLEPTRGAEKGKVRSIRCGGMAENLFNPQILNWRKNCQPSRIG